MYVQAILIFQDTECFRKFIQTTKDFSSTN